MQIVKKTSGNKIRIEQVPYGRVVYFDTIFGRKYYMQLNALTPTLNAIVESLEEQCDPLQVPGSHEHCVVAEVDSGRICLIDFGTEVYMCNAKVVIE